LQGTPTSKQTTPIGTGSERFSRRYILDEKSSLADDDPTPTARTIGNGERDYYRREIARAYITAGIVITILIGVIVVLALRI